ncbi:MAG: CRTAC1 family protein [Acidimicrobiales bacterium]|nr:CRTAC1 family protein [Acidimicrobiales bacterium]
MRFEEVARLSTSPLATSVLDVNGDDRLDLVSASRDRFHVAVAVAEGPGFAEPASVAMPAGESVNGWGLHDLDGDGDLDLIPATRPADRPQLALLNAGDGSFEERRLGYVPDLIQRSVLVTDLDGDGAQEAFVSGSSFRDSHGWNELHVGLPGGGFAAENVIDEVMPAPFWHERVSDPGSPCDGEEWANTWFKGVVVRDFDADGRPDLLLSAYADAGFPDVRCPRFQQEFVSLRSYRGVFLLRNVSTPGNLRFEDVSATAFDRPGNGNSLEDDHVYATVPADVDGDGDLDLFSGGVVYQTPPRARDTNLVTVWRNDSTPGRLRFVDVTGSSGRPAEINAQPPADKGARRLADGVAADLDLDGDVDLAFVNRDDGGEADSVQSIVVFRNDGGMAFTELGPETGLDEYANAVNSADLDGDGRVDLIVDDVFFTRSTFVFTNTTDTDGHWVAVDTRDADGTWPIGAVVTVFEPDGDPIAVDEVRTDYSYRAKRTPLLHFGLGAVDTVDVRIALPFGGGTTWHRDVPADRIVRLSP